MTPEEKIAATALTGMNGPSAENNGDDGEDTGQASLSGQDENNSDAKKSRRKKGKMAHKYPVEPRVIQVVNKPKIYINHSYRDFSVVPAEMDFERPTEIEEMSFSEKIHDILSNAENSKIARWMPHGRAFRIFVPVLFERTLCEKYFGHKRYSSFLRQLNNHGFKHITKGVDRNCYYHECFLMDMPHLCRYMPDPKDARRLIPDPDNELDFYEISATAPVPSGSAPPRMEHQEKVELKSSPTAKIAPPKSLPQTLQSLSPPAQLAPVQHGALPQVGPQGGILTQTPLNAQMVDMVAHNVAPPSDETLFLSQLASRIKANEIATATQHTLLRNLVSSEETMMRARLASQVHWLHDQQPLAKRQAIALPSNTLVVDAASTMPVMAAQALSQQAISPHALLPLQPAQPWSGGMSFQLPQVGAAATALPTVAGSAGGNDALAQLIQLRQQQQQQQQHLQAASVALGVANPNAATFAELLRMRSLH